MPLVVCARHDFWKRNNYWKLSRLKAGPITGKISMGWNGKIVARNDIDIGGWNDIDCQGY